MSGTSEVTADSPAGTRPPEEVLRTFEGRPSAPPTLAPDAVGPAMIRHFVDAVGDENPIYTDEGAAQASGRAGIVAPPAMLQVWTMPTLRQKLAANDAIETGTSAAAGAQDELVALLAAHGYSAVVATDSQQHYLRELRIDDRLRSSSTIETVSPEKRTALGAGHFVTTRTEYTDESGELVATMSFRILLYRPEPRTAAEAGEVAGREVVGQRPRPLVTRDNAFFFEGLLAGEIRIQRCTSCGTLRHPPRPGCAICSSLEYDGIAAAGTGRLHSYVVVHHPKSPGFAYPLPVGLVELTEGVRLVAELEGIDPEDLAVGTELAGEVVRLADDLAVPRFRPAAGPATAVTPDAQVNDAVAVAGVGAGAEGQPPPELPTIEVPLTRTRIVAGALATRDFQDVHHDPDLARGHGAPDIFMNILTTNGYVGRLATDWAGPSAVVDRISIRLGAPNYAGDTMRLSGEVAELRDAGDHRRVALSVRGTNSLGDHVTGRVELRLPAARP